jgi:hypothetical protein
VAPVMQQVLKDQLAADEPVSSLQASAADEWVKYTGTVRYMCRNRSFFLTTQGAVGIAPLLARPGDAVCVLLGCDSTILLRPTRFRPNRVIGQSYMPGINIGEALLGPLPEHLRAVNYYDDEAQGFYFAYLNGLTKRVQLEDPRLANLRLDPKCYADAWKKSGFKRITVGVEASRDAGVAVQMFDLG